MAKKNEKPIDPANEFVDPATLLNSSEFPNGSDAEEGSTLAASTTGPLTVKPPELGAVPVVPGLFNPVVCELSIELALLDAREDVHDRRHGYVSTRIDCQLDGDAGITFRRLLIAARSRHLTYPVRGVMTHVESPTDLVRWLVWTVGQADAAK